MSGLVHLPEEGSRGKIIGVARESGVHRAGKQWLSGPMVIYKHLDIRICAELPALVFLRITIVGDAIAFAPRSDMISLVASE